MRLKALFGAVLLLGSLTACGLNVNVALPYDVKPGSIQAEPSLQGQTVTVGSKNFTENIILGYMAELALSAAGANVIDLTNISGSNSARQALLNGFPGNTPALAGFPTRATTSRSRTSARSSTR